MENNLTTGVWEKLKFEPTYNITNFSIDTLSEAIGEYFKGRPEPTYEDELRYKLDRARRSIKYNDTWYTPTFKELKEGDIVSIMSSWGWVEGTFPSILWQETHVNMAAHKANKLDDIEFRFNHVTIRKRRDG